MALTKAVIVPTDGTSHVPIPVMFNPPSYTLSKANRFAEIRVPGLPSTLLQYVSGDAQTLGVELFFDTTDTGVDVRTRTAAVTNLTEPTGTTRAPPQLLLIWGSLVFPCVLVSVRQEFNYFNPLGMPLRARLQVEFKGSDKLESFVARQPIAQVDAVARHVIRVGDDLTRIASDAYGDPNAWRNVARANGIDDPRSLVPGMSLRLPRF